LPWALNRLPESLPSNKGTKLLFQVINAIVNPACMALPVPTPNSEVPMPAITHSNWAPFGFWRVGPSYEGLPVFHSQSERSTGTIETAREALIILIPEAFF